MAQTLRVLDWTYQTSRFVLKVSFFHSCVQVPTYYVAPVEHTGQPCGIGSLLPPLCGFYGLNSGSEGEVLSELMLCDMSPAMSRTSMPQTYWTYKMILLVLEDVDSVGRKCPSQLPPLGLVQPEMAPLQRPPTEMSYSCVLVQLYTTDPPPLSSCIKYMLFLWCAGVSPSVCTAHPTLSFLYVCRVFVRSSFTVASVRTVPKMHKGRQLGASGSPHPLSHLTGPQSFFKLWAKIHKATVNGF